MVANSPKGVFMANLWNVISVSGEHLTLQRGGERLEIEKPEDPFAQEIFMKVVAGSTASDIGVDLLIHPPKKLPKRAEENEAGTIPHKA
jgi:hypothetical protein